MYKNIFRCAHGLFRGGKLQQRICPSNGKIMQHLVEKSSQIYKTTIPVNNIEVNKDNEQQQSQQPQQERHKFNGNSCQCALGKLLETAVLSHNSPNNNHNNKNDVMHANNNGIPAKCFGENFCCSSRSNENFTTNSTTIEYEYELSSNVAKIKSISQSRVASECSAGRNNKQANQLIPSIPYAEIKEFIQLQKRNFSMDCRTSTLEIAPRDRLGLWGTGDSESSCVLSGEDRLKNKKYNKGLAFTAEERALLGIHGRFPHRIKSDAEQIEHCLLLMDRLKSNLDKYMYLQGLAERNERLFFKLLATDIGKMMPLVYTPTVGEACQNFSLIYQIPKGLFITIKDKGHVYDILKNWPENDVRAIVVTDGERILGLGDLGANGMGISIGKLSLYTALAGVKPHQTLPICLDVGTNTQSILDDPLYLGLREKRVRGTEYEEFVDEFMDAVVRRFGQNCLIQFEDFGNANAFTLLARYRDCYCTFNDDIQGTASVAVAGLCASLQIKNTKLKDNTLVFFGAGEAALGIAGLCETAMIREGLSAEEAKDRIWMVDSKGLIVKDRPTGGLTEHKLHFARKNKPVNTLLETVQLAKPTVLIGASAVGGAFTPEILKLMAKNTDIPIIFALSNPTQKAECTAEQAYTNTDGRCIFASGSPFEPVKYKDKTFYPGQGNNSYIFPGVALGVLCSGMLTIPEEVFLIAAIKLAELVSPEDVSKGGLYPPLKDIGKVSLEIAAVVMEYAYCHGLATVRPEPTDKHTFIKSQMYDLSYPSAIPAMFKKDKKNLYDC